MICIEFFTVRFFSFKKFTVKLVHYLINTVITHSCKCWFDFTPFKFKQQQILNRKIYRPLNLKSKVKSGSELEIL